MGAAEGDKPWCWVVAAACFWVNLCSVGVSRSTSVIFIALIDYFQISREDAAWPTGLYGLFAGLSAMISGNLTSYFSIRSILVVSAIIASAAVSLCSLATSPWHINVLFGCFQGIGIGPISPLLQVIITRYFVLHRTGAIGLSMAGSVAGSMIAPRVTYWFLEEVGLHGTFLLLGGITMNSLVGIAFLRDPDAEKSTTPKVSTVGDHSNGSSSKGKRDPDGVELESRGQSATDIDKGENEEKPLEEIGQFRKVLLHTVHILTNIDACAIITVYSVSFFVYRVYHLVIIDFADERSVSVERGVYLVIICFLGDLIARLTFGWVTDRIKWITRKSKVCLLLFFHGIFALALSFCYSYESLASVYALLGTVYGGMLINQVPLYNEVMNRQLVPVAAGMAVFVMGSMLFLLPVFIGYFKDRYQSYTLMFIWLGVMQFAAIGLWLLVAPIRKLIAKKSNKGIAHLTNKNTDTVT